MTVCVRPRTVQLAVRWNACSCWCSRSACAGRPGGTSGLLISGCLTGRPDAATATAACPARAPWTWTLTIQCGSQTSRLTWSLSLSWPEPSDPICWGMDSKMVKALLGIYLEICFEGVDWQELTQNCAKVSCAKRRSKLSLWLMSVTWKKAPFRLNPILSFTVGKNSNNSNRTFFWCLDRQQPDLTVYKTFYRMITETIPELEHSRIQRVVMVVVVF